MGVLPSPEEDQNDADVNIQRAELSPVVTRSPHACDQGNQARKESCLMTEGRGCMWTQVMALKAENRAQQTYSYCLPCELDGQELPCWNPGARIGDKLVTDCQMSCTHQKRIWQPQYACSDGVDNVFSESQCFSRGTQSGSRCMFLTYTDKSGIAKGSCGPCELEGSGTWGCPLAGAEGPEDGSVVTSCRSQCLGHGSRAEDGEPPSPGVAKTRSPPGKMIAAPEGPPPPMPAGPKKKLRAPSKWQPMVLYRTPGDYAATSLPPMPQWPPSDWEVPP